VDIGDLVEVQSKSWQVYKKDSRVRTLTLLHADGTKLEVADDDPEVIFVASPIKNWPFVALPRKPEKSGPIVSIQRTVRGRVLELKANSGWSLSDPGRAGGSVFLNPDLKLKVGDILVAKYHDGSLSRVPITKTFGTMAQKRQRLVEKGQEADSSLYGILLDD